jgi:hypothetical protein
MSHGKKKPTGVPSRVTRITSSERNTLDEELQRTRTASQPDIDRAQALLEDFARFWDAEPEPAERRKLILSLFAQVWAKDNQIVAVRPNTAFAQYFTAAWEVRATHPKADASSEATIRERRGSNARLAPRGLRSGSRAIAA